MMKIAHINATCSEGSTGSIVRQLHDYADSMGHETRVFYGADASPSGDGTRVGLRLGQVVHAVKSRVTGMQGYASTAATGVLLHQINVFAPDIVHLHNLHANFVNLPLLLGYLAKKNVATVLTLHDCWFFTGKCTYPVQTGCRRWAEEGCHNCPQLKIDNVNPTLFLDRTRKCFEDKRALFSAIPRLGVVGVSDWITGEARSSFLANRNPVRIYNWVDRNVFRPMPEEGVASLRQSLGIGPDEKMVLFVSSNLSERKGYNVLSSLPELVGKEAKIVYVGSNRDNLPLPSSVITPGSARSQEELAVYYAAADICVNATKCETFGLITAEALACGTPVIVNPNTASPELIEEGCGRLLSRQDDVLEVSNIVRTMGRKDRGTVDRCVNSSARFDAATSMANYLEYYRIVVASGKQ